MSTAAIWKWTKIVISLASFCVIFPNALVEDMKPQVIAQLLDGSDEKKS